ncbi:NTP transferase domain-containing protein [Pelagibacterales bacterium SAG-MED02]|nr:NTP transferase domain-containing protein [Pelagibacterales bacterium SAG-MED02]
MNFNIFIQARMNSKRLPGKSLIKINNKPLLQHIFDRLSIFGKKKIIILTSTNKQDNEIEKFCLKNEIKFFRGNLRNVYQRYYDALKKYKCNSFVRITGDSIFVDKKIVKKVINKFKDNNYDIVTNTLYKTFPIGLSVEMIKSSIFLKNEKHIKKLFNKEHIFSYFYENKSKFKIYNFVNKKKYLHSSYAIDNKSDLNRIKKILNEN